MHLDSLEKSDDENADDGGRSSTTQSQAPLPQRRKHGRKPNKPPSAPPRQRSEKKDLDIGSLKRAQTEDESLSYIIDLKKSDREKPSWNESSDKSPET